MDYPTIHSIFTVIIFVAFIALLVWIFLLKRKPDFDNAANADFRRRNEAQIKTTTGVGS